MSRANRLCNYCKTPYYVCKSCVGKNSWKNICCSVDCYRNLMKQKQESKAEELSIIAPVEVDRGETDMKGVLANRKRVDILGFDLKTGRFDCSDETTRVAEDFREFIVSYDELLDIANGENITTTPVE